MAQAEQGPAPLQSEVQAPNPDPGINGDGDGWMRHQWPKRRLRATWPKLTLEQVGLLREVFNIFDTDDKGFFTAYELLEVMRAMGGNPTPQEVEAVLYELDANGDHNVDFPEFLAKFHDCWEADQILNVFNQLAIQEEGADSRKVLTLAALEKCFTYVGDPLSEVDKKFLEIMFQGADKDGNGKLDIAEFTDYIDIMDEEQIMGQQEQEQANAPAPSSRQRRSSLTKLALGFDDDSKVAQHILGFLAPRSGRTSDIGAGPSAPAGPRRTLSQEVDGRPSARSTVGGTAAALAAAGASVLSGASGWGRQQVAIPEEGGAGDPTGPSRTSAAQARTGSGMGGFWSGRFGSLRLGSLVRGGGAAGGSPPGAAGGSGGALESMDSEEGGLTASLRRSITRGLSNVLQHIGSWKDSIGNASMRLGNATSMRLRGSIDTLQDAGGAVGREGASGAAGGERGNATRGTSEKSSRQHSRQGSLSVPASVSRSVSVAPGQQGRSSRGMDAAAAAAVAAIDAERGVAQPSPRHSAPASPWLTKPQQQLQVEGSGTGQASSGTSGLAAASGAGTSDTMSAGPSRTPSHPQQHISLPPPIPPTAAARSSSPADSGLNRSGVRQAQGSEEQGQSLRLGVLAYGGAGGLGLSSHLPVPQARPRPRSSNAASPLGPYAHASSQEAPADSVTLHPQQAQQLQAAAAAVASGPHTHHVRAGAPWFAGAGLSGPVRGRTSEMHSSALQAGSTATSSPGDTLIGVLAGAAGGVASARTSQGGIPRAALASSPDLEELIRLAAAQRVSYGGGAGQQAPPIPVASGLQVGGPGAATGAVGAARLREVHHDSGRLPTPFRLSVPGPGGPEGQESGHVSAAPSGPGAVGGLGGGGAQVGGSHAPFRARSPAPLDGGPLTASSIGSGVPPAAGRSSSGGGSAVLVSPSGPHLGRSAAGPVVARYMPAPLAAVGGSWQSTVLPSFLRQTGPGGQGSAGASTAGSTAGSSSQVMVPASAAGSGSAAAGASAGTSRLFKPGSHSSLVGGVAGPSAPSDRDRVFEISAQNDGSSPRAIDEPSAGGTR